jgi:hypothetical protein
VPLGYLAGLLPDRLILSDQGQQHQYACVQHTHAHARGGHMLTPRQRTEGKTTYAIAVECGLIVIPTAGQRNPTSLE